MGKLTNVCLLSVAYTALFMGCRKDDKIPFGQSITPSVQERVLEIKNQNTDFQHITAQSVQQTEPPTTTPNTNKARFTITYFSFFEGEKDTVFNETQLLTALLSTGLNDKVARYRTDCLFRTNQTSPVCLVETARLLAPTLPAHTAETFICGLVKPYDESAIQTFDMNRNQSRGFTTPYRKTSLSEPIKTIHKLIGVSGSVTAIGDSRVHIYFDSNNSNAPTALLEAQAIRRILQQKKGYTEGEAVFLALILGRLTEEEVWALFENDIVPEWRNTAELHFDGKMARLSFRYNYIEVLGSIGRMGFTIYDMEGSAN